MFYFFEAAAAISAIGIIFVRHVFQGALLFVVCLLAIAGIYVLTFAEFIAVMQILVYAGGILVLIIFGIMLTSKISGKPLRVNHTHIFAGTLVSFFFLIFFSVLFAKEVFASSEKVPIPANAFDVIGVLLLSDFVLPFEIAGVLLLMALVGSAVTASITTKLKH
jgi:NADH:ubiquinone oxidoreductase subunit 6 (subunit J)